MDEVHQEIANESMSENFEDKKPQHEAYSESYQKLVYQQLAAMRKFKDQSEINLSILFL